MQIQIQLGNTQTVTPQMIASIAVLQCGAQELSEYLEEMSYENPMMDLQEPEQKAAPLTASIADKIRWLRGTDRQNQSYYADAERDNVDQYLHAGRAESLCDFVKEQIITLEITPEKRAAMETVAELLDGGGFYTGTVLEIAKIAGCSQETAAEALQLVRSLEPAGVAAENVQQALLLQLSDKPVAKRLIKEHFSHLGSWSVQKISRAMGVSEEAVRAAKTAVAALNPYPSNGFATNEEVQYVTPDLSIIEQDGALQVVAEDGYLPIIHINPEYLRMLETQQDPEVQKYLRQKMTQLEQVIYNVDRRKSTILRCGEVIAARQAAFFAGGAMVKLTLRDVAEELELHESTVSRAVKNKYIQCARGMFPMSAFFSRDVGQNVGLSRSGIQAVMLEIIEAEDKKRPLSDEKIAAELGKRHILLSRRAVAKYRMELGVPPASARKHRTAV